MILAFTELQKAQWTSFAFRSEGILVFAFCFGVIHGAIGLSYELHGAHRIIRVKIFGKTQEIEVSAVDEIDRLEPLGESIARRSPDEAKQTPESSTDSFLLLKHFVSKVLERDASTRLSFSYGDRPYGSFRLVVKALR